MQIVLLNGSTLEANISPEHLWVVYNLVKERKIEASIALKGTVATLNVRRINPELTFGDLIKEGYQDVMLYSDAA